MIPMGRTIRVLARVDCEGRVPLPAPVRRALGLKQNQVVEVRTLGSGRKGRLMVLPRFGR